MTAPKKPEHEERVERIRNVSKILIDTIPVDFNITYPVFGSYEIRQMRQIDPEKLSKNRRENRGVSWKKRFQKDHKSKRTQSDHMQAHGKKERARDRAVIRQRGKEMEI